VWSKASSSIKQVRTGAAQEMRGDGTTGGRAQHQQPADHDLSYQTIDTNVRGAPYTINQKEIQPADGASDAGASGRRGTNVKLISELIKTDVTPYDSGFYRCRLRNGGVSSRILVTVIDSQYRHRAIYRFILIG
jgi:hypothetical protein